MLINRQVAANILATPPVRSSVTPGGEPPTTPLPGELAPGTWPDVVVVRGDGSLETPVRGVFGPRSVDGVAETRAAYVAAAAVLSWFDPEILQPFPRLPVLVPVPVRELLRAQCTTGGEQAGRLMLRAGARREALRALGTRRALGEARAANAGAPPADDELQGMMDLAIAGELPDLASLSGPQATALLQVIDWFGGIEDMTLPSADAVRRARNMAELTDRFRTLVGQHFRGRRDELQQLRDYTGVLLPGSAREYVRRTVRWALDLREEPPLLIHGPGGMGKSTLLARFILDHLEPEPRLAFAYLDFDRVDLSIEEPISLLVEAARQLAIQVDDPESRWTRWCEQLLERIHEPSRPPAESAYAHELEQASSGGSDLASLTPMVVQEFARLVEETVPPSSGPLLLVFDTFEEVQYRSREWVHDLWFFLQDLQRALPDLRTVIAGRAPIAEFETRNLELSTLDSEAAVGYLVGRGVPEARAVEVASRFGGNPLSLKLAAEVLRTARPDEDGLAGLSTRRLLFFAVKDELVQGQLYRRILNHIHDERVRSLAHPGLVLRRITPELILEVLAEPCNVTITGLDDANAVFEAMRAEVSLVTASDDGALRHRPDVRRIMLALLQESNPSGVEQIHRGAIDFYARRDDVPSRAEEVYHRLALGEDRATIEGRWVEGIEPFLASSLDELPLHSRTLLASRVGRELPKDVWAGADQSEWEQRTATRVKELLASSAPRVRRVAKGASEAAVGEVTLTATDRRRLETALSLLKEREHRLPGSVLWVLEAAVWERLGELERTREVCRQGIDALGQTGDGRALLVLLRTLARISVQLDGEGSSEGAQALRDAWALAAGLGDDAIVEVALEVLETLDPASDTLEASACADLEGALASAAQRLPDEYFATRMATLRRIVSRVSAQAPTLLERGLRLAGLPRLDARRARELAEVLAEWEQDVPTERRAAFADMRRSLGVSDDGPREDAWGRVLADAKGDARPATSILLLLLFHFPPGHDVRVRLAALMEEGRDEEVASRAVAR